MQLGRQGEEKSARMPALSFSRAVSVDPHLLRLRSDCFSIFCIVKLCFLSCSVSALFNFPACHVSPGTGHQAEHGQASAGCATCPLVAALPCWCMCHQLFNGSLPNGKYFACIALVLVLLRWANQFRMLAHFQAGTKPVQPSVQPPRPDCLPPPLVNLIPPGLCRARSRVADALFLRLRLRSRC